MKKRGVLITLFLFMVCLTSCVQKSGDVRENDTVDERVFYMDERLRELTSEGRKRDVSIPSQSDDEGVSVEEIIYDTDVMGIVFCIEDEKLNQPQGVKGEIRKGDGEWIPSSRSEPRGWDEVNKETEYLMKFQMPQGESISSGEWNLNVHNGDKSWSFIFNVEEALLEEYSHRLIFREEMDIEGNTLKFKDIICYPDKSTISYEIIKNNRNIDIENVRFLNEDGHLEMSSIMSGGEKSCKARVELDMSSKYEGIFKVRIDKVRKKSHNEIIIDTEEGELESTLPGEMEISKVGKNEDGKVDYIEITWRSDPKGKSIDNLIIDRITNEEGDREVEDYEFRRGTLDMQTDDNTRKIEIYFTNPVEGNIKIQSEEYYKRINIEKEFMVLKEEGIVKYQE